MNGLLHDSPSESTISNILKEFTVVFLLKCYGLLVKDLHTQLLLQTEPVRFLILSTKKNPNNNFVSIDNFHRFFPLFLVDHVLHKVYS